MDGEDDDAQGKVIVMERPKSLQELLELGIKRPVATHRETVKPPPAATRMPVPPATVTEAEPADSPPKKSDPLPRPGDRYRAHAAYLSRLASDQRHLHFVDKDCFSVGFSYHDLRRVSWAASGKSGVGPVLVLHFVDWAVTEIRIEGRNLEDIRHWVGEGLMPWLWEQPAGFKNRSDQAVVITGFTFQEFEK